MPNRNEQEIEIAKYILNETKKPLLAICRGIQVLNVAVGGNIYQNLEKDGTFEHHFMDTYPMNYISHEIKYSMGQGQKLLQSKWFGWICKKASPSKRRKANGGSLCRQCMQIMRQAIR